MNLSKTRYTLGVTCPKLLWLKCFKPEEAEEINNTAIFQNGNEIGALARRLFGDDYILIDYDKGLDSMLKETDKYMKDKPNIICEATFDYQGNFCSVDVLKNDVDGVEIYEVKSATKLKEINIEDISYQIWVLKKLGLNVKKSCVVHVNGNYVKNGDLDIHEFFSIEDITDLIDCDEVEENSKELKKVIDVDKEPELDLSINCHDPYDCEFFNYCTRNLPHPNVFDLDGVNFNTKLDLYRNNIISFKDLEKEPSLKEKTLDQINHELYYLEPKINKEVIKDFLKDIKYPLYFLDFETYQSVIPMIDGTKPYEQITFQYSLHYYLEENGKLYHKEYLSDNYYGDPREDLARQLCEDIPMDVPVIAYNMSFERGRIKEMAEAFPKYRKHLLNIENNIIDLLPIFKKHHYYVREMEGSASIKHVLPALFPNDKELDYKSLPVVHKGDEASNAFVNLKNMDEEEEQRVRDGLLKYCELDTLAMVKIFDKLKEIVKID